MTIPSAEVHPAFQHAVCVCVCVCVYAYALRGGFELIYDYSFSVRNNRWSVLGTYWYVVHTRFRSGV